ncbi:MAG: Gamma-glutamylanilide synthase [Alphaproteobacteria bacterium MarineAlpha11_Bin1]|nr:MAG: Gamma-glutamylanilide synthase [Alphaproteobacteria bacterium MarineAlpha11_Bin1]
MNVGLNLLGPSTLGHWRPKLAVRNDTMGRTGFVEEFQLSSEEDQDEAARVKGLVEENRLEVIRLSYPDQHGILRGKTVMASEIEQALRNGCAITTTLLAKDTSHKTVFPVFSPGGGFGIPEMENAGDFVAVPLPSTFRILPWAPNTGWMLCDGYLANGEPVPFSTRQLLKKTLSALVDRGFDYVAGIEVECHIYHLDDAMLQPEDAGQPATAPKVSLINRGYNYLTELRMDEQDPVFEILRRGLLAIGLPLRTLETEFGPSQFEFTLGPTSGLEAADNMILFRNALKQICRRNGFHATFMCRPGLSNTFASGWHLHQSLENKSDGANAFAPTSTDNLLSPTGLSFVAGILKNAPGAAVFTTPTINGYKRYQPNSLAPDRVVWGRDNKGAMLRIIGAGPNDSATRIENRVGEPAANPYLYLASQVASGLDGLRNDLVPPPATDDPYAANAEQLPTNLMDAVIALDKNKTFRAAFGDQFIDYLLHIKRAEIERFLSTVTDWEHREYFELF